MDEDKKVQLFLPLWQNNISFKGRNVGPRPYSYRQRTKPNLIYGSLVNSRVHKGDFIFLEAPFVFLVFQMNSSDALRRILFGHIVT